MPKFSQFSKDNLATCHIWLQDIFNIVIMDIDCRVICGHRNKKAQMIAYQEGRSQLQWPDSSHNKTPSLAVDVVPYPIDWDDIERFKELGWYAKGVAKVLKYPIQWGGDWKTFKDYPHYQIK